MDGLNAILSEEVPTQVEQEEPQTEVIAEQTEVATGEEAATPAETQDDQIDKHRKGLEAAAVAERQKRQAAEQRAQALEAELAKFTKPAEQPKPFTRPQRDQYQTQEDYEDALLEYGDRRRDMIDQQKQAQREQETQAQEFQRTADATVAKGREKYRDFDAVINDGLGPFLNPVLQQALVLGGGHEIAYWLGKNPAEAARVSQLPPMQMILEIGRLEAKMSAPEKVALPQTLTQARDARGKFQPYSGPTPLDEIVAPARR